MKNIILLILSIFIFTSCSNKIQTDVNSSNEIKLKSNEKKSVFINYTNQTNEDIRLVFKLRQELKNLNYKVASRIEYADYNLVLNVVFANKIDKKSTATNILSKVRVGLGLGSKIFNNIGLSGSIGASIGSILGDSLDEESYQIVVDVSVEDLTDNENATYNNRDSQIVAEAILNNNSKKEAIKVLEDEIVKRVSGFFY